MNWLTRSLGSLLLGCTVWALPIAAFAEYPDKPIRLIVPQAAGSATDTVARILAAELGPQLGGSTIVVEDKPGAAFTIGLDLVAKAAPDGYTVGIGPIGALAISPNMVAKLPYVIAKDLQPIALIVHGHLMLVVSPKSDIKSVKELIAKAKANPGKLTNASSANGSPGHVGGELFKYHDRHADPARAVPRRGRRDQRPDRGPCRSDVREPQLDFAAWRSRARCGASASAATSARRHSPISRPSPRRACRATARRPGPG